MKVTVVIPTLNEEIDLPSTLDTLDFADEILIVDSGSTDKTLKIAKENHCRILHLPFKNFAHTRNFADQKAKNDWILSIDADVMVPENLAAEIENLPDTKATYKIGRINLIWGKPILHADWGPYDDNHIRLYHRSLGKWKSDVHEQFVSKTPPRQLRHLLIHKNYETISEFIGKINTYSEISSQSNLSKNFLYSVIAAKKDFFKRYFYKLGFLDGYHGFFLSYLQAVYFLVVGIKKLTKTIQ